MAGTIVPLHLTPGSSPSDNVFAVSPPEHVDNYVLATDTPVLITLTSYLSKIIVLSWPVAQDLWFQFRDTAGTWPIVADITNGDGWANNPGPIYIPQNMTKKLILVSPLAMNVGISVYKTKSS